MNPAGSTLAPVLEDRILEMRHVVRGIVYTKFRNVPANIDRDDMIQAGMVGVCTAALRWNPAKGLFVSYVTTRAIGAIKDHLNRERGSYRTKLDNVERESHRVYPLVPGELNERRDLARDDSVFAAWEAIECVLTSLELRTLKRWLCGLTAVEIGRQDGVTEFAVGHRLKNVRRKLAPIFRPHTQGGA